MPPGFGLATKFLHPRFGTVPALGSAGTHLGRHWVHLGVCLCMVLVVLCVPQHAVLEVPEMSAVLLLYAET